MSKLNHEWAIKEIDQFLRVTDQVGYDNSGGGVVVLGTHLRGSQIWMRPIFTPGLGKTGDPTGTQGIIIRP
jgi:hypothetical protein